MNYSTYSVTAFGSLPCSLAVQSFLFAHPLFWITFTNLVIPKDVSEQRPKHEAPLRILFFMPLVMPDPRTSDGWDFGMGNVLHFLYT